MTRVRATRQLVVWMNGERVGDWTLGAGNAHSFSYAADWLASPSRRPISLSMPLRSEDAAYKGAVVENFFDNLLPDSAEIRRRIRTRFKTASDRAFDLLTEIGRDCVGAIQLLPPELVPQGVDRIEGEALSEADVARLLRQTAGTGQGTPEAEDFRISLAGAQEKTALLRLDGQWHRPLGVTPTTHILKLPMGRVGNMQADLRTSVENEWLCARLVRAYGLEVAECMIATFEDQKVLVVTRFDRRMAASGTHWLRLPQEDLCQAMGIPPTLKYEADGGPSIGSTMDLLPASAESSKDRQTFFKAQLVFWLLCAIDGHGKNFSLAIEPEGRFRLTPLYDVLSAYPILGEGPNQLAPQRAKMAMAAISKNRHYEWMRIAPRHWMATAKACGLPETIAREVMEEVTAETVRVIDEVAEALPRDFPADLAEAIFAGMRGVSRKAVG